MVIFSNYVTLQEGLTSIGFYRQSFCLKPEPRDEIDVFDNRAHHSTGEFSCVPFLNLFSDTPSIIHNISLRCIMLYIENYPIRPRYTYLLYIIYIYIYTYPIVCIHTYIYIYIPDRRYDISMICIP